MISDREAEEDIEGREGRRRKKAEKSNRRRKSNNKERERDSWNSGKEINSDPNNRRQRVDGKREDAISMKKNSTNSDNDSDIFIGDLFCRGQSNEISNRN